MHVGRPIKRRRVLKTFGAGAVTWAAGQAMVAPSWNIIRSRAALADAGPDVYVITLDDCSPEYIGYYQSLLATAYPGPVFTPELDALFAASWTSTSARANVAVCAASRSSFLTGVGPDQTGVYGFTDNALVRTPTSVAAFLAKVQNGELVSLPGFLTASGLDTAARGKVDHSGGLFNIPGQIAHAGVYTSITDLSLDPDYAPDGIVGSDLTFLPFATLPDTTDHVDKLRVDEQITRINSAYNGQRVDFIGFAMPHTPRTVHQTWIDLYDLADIQLRTDPSEVANDQSDIPGTAMGHLEVPYLQPGGIPRATWMDDNLSTEQLKLHLQHMLATVSHTSFHVGRLVDALHAAGRPFELVLTSDHGYFMGSKGHYGKGSVYDKGLLAPLAVYSSEGNASYPVGNSELPVGLMGLPKTVAQLAGISEATLPSGWEGHRFDDLTNPCHVHSWGQDANESRALVFRTTVGNTFKLVVHPGDLSELYNLTNDPAELDNLLVPNAAPEAATTDAVERTAARTEAEEDLDLRARRQRAADWLASGGDAADPANL